MLYYFEAYNMYAEITGYSCISFQKAEAYLKRYRKLSSSVELQFFDADLIATEEHLYFAVLNALQAFRSKTNASKSVAVETMLYASAQRQIQKSIEFIGVKPQSHNLAIVIMGEDKEQVENQLQALTQYLGRDPNGAILRLTEAKIQKIQLAFQISKLEMETQREPAEKVLVNLVVERMALLSTQF